MHDERFPAEELGVVACMRHTETYTGRSTSACLSPFASRSLDSLNSLPRVYLNPNKPEGARLLTLQFPLDGPRALELHRELSTG